MMKKFVVFLAVAVLFASSSVSPAGAAQDSPAPTASSLSELLEKAIFTEESVGDLDAAIEIYQTILAEAEASRPYVAQAQFRLGMCYLKQGKEDKAAAALQRVLTNFPKQRELVEQARTRLTELGHPMAAAATVTRQVWAGSEVDILGVPSPDDRYLTFVDWETGDLAIRDLASGKNRHLTNKGSWWESKEYAEYSVVSPDTRQVAYVWFNSELFHELRLVGIDGSGHRVLYRNDEPGHIQPHA